MVVPKVNIVHLLFILFPVFIKILVYLLTDVLLKLVNSRMLLMVLITEKIYTQFGNR